MLRLGDNVADRVPQIEEHSSGNFLAFTFIHKALTDSHKIYQQSTFRIFKGRNFPENNFLIMREIQVKLDPKMNF